MRYLFLLSLALVVSCATAPPPPPRTPTFSFPVPAHAKSKAWVCVKADNGVDLECVDMEQFLAWAAERHSRVGENWDEPSNEL